MSSLVIALIIVERIAIAVEGSLGITTENRPSIKDFFSGERIK